MARHGSSPAGWLQTSNARGMGRAALSAMRLDQLIKQCVLWLMLLVLKWTNWPEIVLECIGWQDRESLGSCNKQPYPSPVNAVSAFTVLVIGALARSK